MHLKPAQMIAPKLLSIAARPPSLRGWLLLTALLLLGVSAHAEDGYRLWLRYDLIEDSALRARYVASVQHIVLATPAGADSPTMVAARDELTRGLSGLLGAKPSVTLDRSVTDSALGDEGFAIHGPDAERHEIVIHANRDIGALYGAFAFLRHLQTHQSLDHVALTSTPKIQRRLLNHWDNLNGLVERGAAGFSLWEWFRLPEIVSPRYRDYARANASIGINGTVLTNVNANALVLTAPYLKKVAALADVFRPYGIRVYLTARFSSPIEIGGLKTADPLSPEVRAWWEAKTTEIYQLIPDFGGFLVKANSEGQPGPQAYGRTHADGANVLADALAPHGGIVMWRAFVYDNHVPDDRAKQGYAEFQPLDGRFRENVVVQVKNGAIDFMPREPFHPLFGAMPQTPLALELQITQEYLGGATHLAFLGPLFEEVLDSDTLTRGPGSTVGRVIDGSLDHHRLSAIAGVANIGNDRNWTGHPLAQANWYAYGRLAWDHNLDSAAIADEWIRQSFSNEGDVVDPLKHLLLASREAVVDYSMPLGLHHIMAEGHHYGPGPWVDKSSRADWTATYYHRADANGIGFDRTSKGSNALAQYAPALAARWENPRTTPENLLLWFHHLPWDYTMNSGRPLWDELALHYQRGVESVRTSQKSWDALAPKIDQERFSFVKALLARQESDAREWRDACLLYFQQFSHRPLPAGVEPPEHPLEYYRGIQRHFVPGDPSAR